MGSNFQLNVQGEKICAHLSPITHFDTQAILFLSIHLNNKHCVNTVITHIFQTTKTKWKIQPSMHHIDNDQEKLHLYLSLTGDVKEMEKVKKVFFDLETTSY